MSKTIFSYFQSSFDLLIDNGEPSSFHEARESEIEDKSMKSMDEVMKGLHKNERWELVDLLLERKLIRTKWLYKVKKNNDGSLKCFFLLLSRALFYYFLNHIQIHTYF